MITGVRTAIEDARSHAVPGSGSRPNLQVVAALGRVEAVKMLRHPSFLLSIAFTLLLFRGAIGASDEGGLTLNVTWLMGGIALGTLIASVLTSNVASLRARRDRLGELYGSLPSPAEARTAGVLLGLVAGLGGLALVVGALTWLTLERLEGFAEDVDAFMYSQYLLTVVALGAAGVAIARWIPIVLGGPLFVIGHVFTGLIWVVPWIAITSSGISVGWHLTYLVAMTITFAALAFARDRRTVVRFAVAAAAFGFAVLAAGLQGGTG